MGKLNSAVFSISVQNPSRLPSWWWPATQSPKGHFQTTEELTLMHNLSLPPSSLHELSLVVFEGRGRLSSEVGIGRRRSRTELSAQGSYRRKRYQKQADLWSINVIFCLDLWTCFNTTWNHLDENRKYWLIRYNLINTLPAIFHSLSKHSSHIPRKLAPSHACYLLSLSHCPNLMCFSSTRPALEMTHDHIFLVPVTTNLPEP